MLRISIKWGVILGLSIVVGTQILTWLGYGLTNWFVAITYLAVIITVLYGSRNLRNTLREDFTMIKAMLAVLIMVIISRYIFQTYMFIYINYIEPDWIEKVSEIWTEMLQEKNVAAEQIQQKISTFHRAYEPLNMFTVEIIYIGLSQIILGCIVAGSYKWLSSRKSE